MKVLIFSDLQADEGSDRLRSDPGVPLQRWRVKRFFDWATAVAREKQVGAVWDLGDTTNNRTALAHPTVQLVTRGCAQLTAGTSVVHNFKLIGNHEQHLKAREAHVGDLFSPYFNVVEDRAVFHLPAGLSVVCASFQYDNHELSTWVAETTDKLKAAGKRVVILGHFAVHGSKLSSGLALTGSPFPASSLAAADLVLLGHVHRRQRIGQNGWYVGSPFQQDFGEASDPAKAIVILDTRTLELEWIASPFPVYRIVTVDELPVAAESNDVLRVVVRNNQEAERLYASPHAGSVEPVYAFNEGETETEVAPNTETSFAALTQRYVQAFPLAETTADELLGAVRALL